MIICVTGHRSLYGYDIFNWRWMKLKEVFKKLLVEMQCEEAITGMALGVDIVFALAVLELKYRNYPIKLHYAIPCKNQSTLWNQRIEIYTMKF